MYVVNSEVILQEAASALERGQKALVKKGLPGEARAVAAGAFFSESVAASLLSIAQSLDTLAGQAGRAPAWDPRLTPGWQG